MPHSCLLAASPRDMDTHDLCASTSIAPARPSSSSLTSATESTQRSSTIQYTLHATPLANSSSPPPSPFPCEPSTLPGTLSMPPSRPDAVFLPQLRPGPPPCAFSVATLFWKVTRLVSGCFRFLSSPRSSCACSSSSDASRFTETTSLRSEHPPGGPATVASALGHLSEPYDMSTTHPTLLGSSLTHYFTLYRALATSLRVADAAVRHAGDRGREGRVERARVIAMESWG